jgi:DNA-binding NtrC family response regulator
MRRLCLVEDDPIMSESLLDRFAMEGFNTDWFENKATAIEAIRTRSYDMVLSDVRLPDGSGEDLLFELGDSPQKPAFVFITAHATVDRAVEMIKAGALDYITKPFDINALISRINTIGPGQCVAQGDQIDLKGSELGISSLMRALQAQCSRIAARARTVLITGESGTGKEVLARHIHDLALHANTGGVPPFIAVNCGAIPENLVEAELFGYERGAFTGAEKPHKGFIKQANDGTLFLDEIAELPLSSQVKLLRVLQEREVQSLGSTNPRPVNLRIICATHQNLPSLVKQGRFREDLFYRINVVHLHVPSLRERPEDILWFAEKFLRQQALRLEESALGLSSNAKASLLAYQWPGNVRELQNKVEKACVLSTNHLLLPSDFFETKTRGPVGLQPASPPTLHEFVREAEHHYLEETLYRCNGKAGDAAKALGISRKTLWEKCKRYGIRHQSPSSDNATS